MNGQKEDIESPPRADLETEDADVTLPEIDPDAAPEPAPVEAVIAGHAAIRHHLKGAPSTPGIYRMINAAGDVLYVGKAKNIRKRLLAYVRPGGHQARISRMIATTASVEFVSTATETEALLLEANLIKRSRPRFNVVMRDDKSFPYILITGDHVSPQICKHRGARSRGGDFYGPFASVWAVNRTINALQRAFLIRSCSDGFYASRVRPCLLHQIKRCAAPCTGEISHTEYAKLVAQAKTFLSGGSSTVRERLSKEMEEASVALDFERAAIYRDRLAALSSIQSNQGINPRTFEEADVFAAFQEGGFTCIQVFFFRTGQNWGNRAYFPKADKRLSASEVLGAFLAQFYDDKPIPRLILISHEFKDRALLAEALSIKTERRVEISLPQRGEKKELIAQAIANAKEALGRKLAETSSQQALLASVAECFALARPPRRVEIYDNSHIQGSNAVGAMVVAGPEGFAKNQYRKFNIRSKQLAPGDDYGMMREVLTRRFKRLIEESPRASDVSTSNGDDATSWPDLMLIDGGQGQLTAAVATLAELGINDVPVVAISKGEDRNAGRETFHVPGRAAFQLPPRDPVLYFLERLRDEAHRFAIGSHRARRKKDIRQAGLQDIPGIGPIRKRALLHHFGTLRAIERAGMSDLEQVPGIDAETARKIYQYFHER